MKKITLCMALIIALLLIPGVILAAEGNVAKIGDTEYATLADAVNDVPTGTETTITLLRDVESGCGFVVQKDQNIIIDFAGYTYDASIPLVGSTGTETNGCQLKKGSTVTLKNGTLTSTTASILIQNYSNLTLKDMTVDTTNGVAEYTMSNNCGKVLITGNTSIKGNNVAIDMCWWPRNYSEGTQITIDTTGTITGAIELGTFGNVTDTTNIKSTLVIENVNHVGKIVATQDYLKEQATIEGGTFNSDVSEYQAEGYAVKLVNGSYVAGKENKIAVIPAENGTISVDKETAIAGETVTVTAIANEDYEFEAIIVNGKEIKDSKFVMPDAEVTVSAKFAKKVVEEPTTSQSETEEEKDNTPKTGVETTFTVFTVLAVVSLAGLVLVKKR